MRDKTSLLTVTPGLNLKNVILFSVLLRTVLFIIIEPWNLEFETHPLFFYDPQEYHELAKAMLGWDFLDNTLRTPGYPAFIAVFYWLFGVNPPIIYAIQLILTVFSVYMTYRVTNLFFSAKISSLAALLLAIDPHYILFSFNLLSEALFVPVILIVIYYLILFFRTSKIKYLILVSVFMAISAYVRPVTLYLAPAMLPLFLMMGKGSISTKLKTWGVMAMIFYVLLSPWYLRNYTKFDSWSFCTTGGYNILYVYAASIEYSRGGGNMEEVWMKFGQNVDSLVRGSNGNPFLIEEAQQEVGMNVIKKYPVLLVQNHLIGVFNIFFSVSSYRFSRLLGIEEIQLSGSYYGTSNASKIENFIREKGVFSILLTAIFLILFIIEYSSAIWGVIVLLKEKEYILLLTVLFFIFYLLGLTGLFGFQARFKLPLMPFYLIFSAYGMHTVKKWYVNRKQTDTVRDL